MTHLEQALRRIFAEKLADYHKLAKSLDIEVNFYPYAGLNNTIRLNDYRVRVRISDILADAPLSVHRALAAILVAKLFRRRVDEGCEQIFKEYVSTPEILKASDRARRKRGYKQITTHLGKVYDLEEIFQKLNKSYFDGQLKKPVLSWSQRKTRRILGHHDSVHNAIIISKTLDSPDVPRYFVEYVLYHEMLHIKHKAKIVRGRCYYHTPEFYLDEKRFRQYRQAMRWLEDFAARRRR